MVLAFNDTSPNVLHASATQEPKRIQFTPAYSGGLLYTSGISIPESLEVNGETYPAGTEIPVVIDLDSVRLEDNIPILYNHNGMYRLGHTETVRTDGHAITAKGFLSSPSEWVQEVVESANAGARWQCSVGSGTINPADKQLVQETETIQVNGQVLQGPFLLLKNLRIAEISLVPAGADPDTEVLLGSARPAGGNNRPELAKELTMGFESWCAAKGINLETLDDANKAALKALYESTLAETSNETAGETVTADVGTENAENETVKADADSKEEDGSAEGKENDASGKPDENDKDPAKNEAVAASAIRGVQRGEQIIASLNTPMTGSTGSARDVLPTKSEILQCSALLKLGVDDKWLAKNGYSPRCLDSADERVGSISLQYCMGEALRAAGVSVDYHNANAIVDSYKELLKASAVSTRSFGEVNIFSPILDKLMRYKFERLESIWTQLLRKRSVRNFDEVASVSFDVLGRAKDIPENGDYPEVLLKSSGEKFAVTKQGVVGAVSLESQVSDDMGALDSIGDQLVLAIVDVQTDKFWKLWYSQRDTMFSGSNAITKKLSVAGVTTAKKAFKAKKNANGRFLNVPPKFLFVPPALEDSAMELFKWQWAGENNTRGNIHAGAYTVLSDPYLGTDGGYTGASDTAWYMLADPSRYPLGEYATMQGFETPRIKESWYDHKDALNLRAMGTVGFLLYTTDVPAVYSTGTAD